LQVLDTTARIGDQHAQTAEESPSPTPVLEHTQLSGVNAVEYGTCIRFGNPEPGWWSRVTTIEVRLVAFVNSKLALHVLLKPPPMPNCPVAEAQSQLATMSPTLMENDDAFVVSMKISGGVCGRGGFMIMNENSYCSPACSLFCTTIENVSVIGSHVATLVVPPISEKFEADFPDKATEHDVVHGFIRGALSGSAVVLATDALRKPESRIFVAPPPGIAVPDTRVTEIVFSSAHGPEVL